MSIKYKIILALISIIIIISLPLSYYITDSQRKIQIKNLIENGKLNVSMFSLSTKSILIMNGGEILPSRLDSEDILNSFKPLVSEGLVLAESFLLSENKSRNGLLLSRLKEGKIQKQNWDKTASLGSKEIADYLSNSGKEVFCDQDKIEKCYQFISACTWKSQQNFCLVRMLISPSVVQKRIQEIISTIRISTFLIICISIIMGLFITRLITKPIGILSKGVTRIGEGDLNYQVEIKSQDEIGRLAFEFNQMAQKLLQADRLKDEFLANTSHELRTPLNGIVGIVDSLIDGIAGDVKGPMFENLTMIKFSGQRLINLVGDILDFSQLKHDSIKLNLKPLGLGGVIDSVLSILRPLAKEKNIQLESSLEGEIPWVIADEDRLQQILFNLAGNAIKFQKKAL